MPWLPPLRRAKPAQVDLAHCNGCARCAEDCPYEAIRMVRRTDGLPFPTQAQVNPSLCVSCGICVGACPSSTPFRRTRGAQDRHRSARLFAEGVARTGHRRRRYVDEAGPRAGARLRARRRRRTPRWNGRHALRRDGAAVADRLRPQPRPRRRRGGRWLRRERLLQPPRHRTGPSSALPGSAIPICARGFRASALPRSGPPRSR